MTTRDRLMLMGIALVAMLAAVWVLAVSPAKKQADAASREVSSARSQLAQAQTELAEARSAQSRYHTAYATLASLGQAVPTSPEVPALVYALDKASSNHKVQFSSIVAASSGSGSSSSSSSSSSAAAASAPFTQMPFTFTFEGSYEDLVHLLGQIERFTVQVPGGPVEVSGRLLTIQSVTLGGSQGASAVASSASSNNMSWTVGASAYVLAPSSTGAGASTASAGGTQASSAAGASSGGSASTATPAVVRVNG
jgi:Tfp pilus assembly protein PilO